MLAAPAYASHGHGPPDVEGIQHVVWGRVEAFGRRSPQHQVEFLTHSSDSGHGGSQILSSSGETSRSVMSINTPIEQQGRNTRRSASSPSSGPQPLQRAAEDAQEAGVGSVAKGEEGASEVACQAERVLVAAGLWSRGMPKHFSGGCVTCHWVHTAGGCKRGNRCEFCHLPHTSPDLTRLGENRRAHCHAFAVALTDAMRREGFSAEEFSSVANLVSDRSTYVHALLFADGAGAQAPLPTKVLGGKRLLSL
mmetsp:Transcript_125934/g.352615  ORF Transcript_125934/g.352615 Transcript_125934/m.352615 type:complete len:251 (-) Transcript_125934:119-871(-)